MNQIQQHTFSYAGPRPDRLDRALRTLIGAGVSREKIKALINAGLCSVDSSVCTDPAQKIRTGQLLELNVPEESSDLIAEDGDVNIVWSDESLMIINKPAGLTVHPAPSCPQGTLIQRLLSLCPALSRTEGWRPGIVHRIDKDTSGLIIIAPDEAARLGLAQAFAERTINKVYLAIVAGVMHPASGTCNAPLGRHSTNKVKMAVVEGGREANTEWETLHVADDASFSVLKVRIHTGRTHQIRVHMAYLGHPLLGDSIYAPRNIAARAPRQMLHAWRLGFTHPLTGQSLHMTCPPPTDFMQVLCHQKQSMHVVITGLPGSGKSLLTQELGALGLPVWSADDVVRELYTAGGDGWQLINRQYRGQFTASGQAVDKAALADALRTTPGMREELESIIHPLVNARLLAFWQQADSDQHELAIAEVPLWLEMGASKPKHGPSLGPVTLIGVNCTAENRHTRLRERRNWTDNQIAAADSWQWPEAKKMAACGILIDNNAGPDELRQNAHDLHANLLQQRHAQHTACVRSWNKIFEQAQ